MNEKPRQSFAGLWNISFGFFGIQIGFALQNANMSRIFQTFGAKIDDLPWLWVAAPLTGLLVQPVIGHLSDRTWLGRLLDRIDPRLTMLFLVAFTFVIYWSSNTSHVMGDFYNHFVWQAQAWLDGSAAIPFPSDLGRYGNDYFQDVLPVLDANGDPTGTALIPFPPLPAVILLPFVALFGLATSAPAVTSSPCAKFVSPVVPKMSDSPIAAMAISRPKRIPSTSSWTARTGPPPPPDAALSSAKITPCRRFA